MLEDFKRALARVQSDYQFYVECQTNPAVALSNYDLTPDERSALSDPKRLGDVLEREIGVAHFVKITIKGTHDWINRAATGDATLNDAKLAAEVAAIKQAKTDGERSLAVLRLIEQIG